LTIKRPDNGISGKIASRVIFQLSKLQMQGKQCARKKRWMILGLLSSMKYTITQKFPSRSVLLSLWVDGCHR